MIKQASGGCKPPDEETYVACLTPAGAGAIASFALRGPRAASVVSSLFRPRSPAKELPETLRPSEIWLGRFGEDTADDVVLSIKSKDPVPYIEIHCHGGHAATTWLQEQLEKRGVQVCSWQQLQQRIAATPIQAGILSALALAPTSRTAVILLDQYWGACSRALADILSAWDSGDAERTSRLLDQLALFANVGRHLTDPWRVVIAGAPNVGKSSLVNALVGYYRCVVSPRPGTTRDLVTTLIALDGWPIELFDTAGLGTAAEDLEQQGMLLTRQASAAADLCIWVMDASASPVWPDSQTENMRFVINKVDLAPAWDLNEAAPALRISALNGIGIDKLSRLIAEWLVQVPPSPGAGVPFEPDLCAQVEDAWRKYVDGDTNESRKILDAVFQTISRT